MITNITLFFIKTFHNLKLDAYIEKNNNKILVSNQSLLWKRNVKMKKKKIYIYIYKQKEMRKIKWERM